MLPQKEPFGNSLSGTFILTYTIPQTGALAIDGSSKEPIFGMRPGSKRCPAEFFGAKQAPPVHRHP